MNPEVPKRTNVLSLADLLALHIPEPETLIGPFAERHLCLLYAAPGVGKSMVALSIALAVAGKGSLFGWEAPQARKVLYVDGELDLWQIQSRAASLAKATSAADAGLGDNLLFLARHDPKNVQARWPDLNTRDGQDEVMRHIVNHKPSLVILDNFSTLTDIDDENVSSAFNAMMRLLQELKALGTAVILVHHSRKDGATYRGSSKIAAVFSSLVALRAAPTDGLGIEWRWEKFRDRADDTTRLRGFTATLGDDAWTIADLPDELTERVLAAILSCEYGSQRDVARAVGCSLTSVNRAIQKLKVAGRLNEKQLREALSGGCVETTWASDETIDDF